MKLEELRHYIVAEKLLKKWSWDSGTTWSWNSDGSVDVQGNIRIEERSIKKIPFKFNKVSGSFYCSRNYLTTLENCPEEVGYWFGCSDNALETLEHSPKTVKDSYYCDSNPVKFNEEDVKKVCKVGRVINT